MMAHSLFLNALESALCRFIRMDPDAELFLRPLAGKVIRLTLETPDISFYLCPTLDGVQILQDFGGEADTNLQGSLIAFADLGLKQRPIEALFSGQISITGDTQVGRDFQNLFERLEIDWEEQISRVTGDIVGHQLARLCRSAASWGKETVTSLKLDLTDYLQEETRSLPTRIEIEHLFFDIDELRSDLDRLQVRIDRLIDNTFKSNA